MFNKFAQTIGSNEYRQSMFWIKNKKKIYTCNPCIPPFYCAKVGYKGVYITWTCFPDVWNAAVCELHYCCYGTFEKKNSSIRVCLRFLQDDLSVVVFFSSELLTLIITSMKCLFHFT